MMKIPVLWVHHDDDGMCRGYWDEGFLEAVMAREVWVPPNEIEFFHREIHGDFPGGLSGAVVVLPARYHADHIDWFMEQLDRLQWSVVILAGDEEWVFPWERVIETDTRRVWVMQPRPEHADLSYLIPGGWYPRTHEQMEKSGIPTEHRPLDWFFAGQVMHPRRGACAEVLRELNGGFLLETPGYTQGMPQDEYWEMMKESKIVPCPSGPQTVDTARTFEALEAACIPVSDLLKPTDDPPQFNYWDLLFGEGHPLPVIADWSTLPAEMSTLISHFTPRSNECFAFWQQWKRRTALQLDTDIIEVMQAAGCEVPAANKPSDRITVIISTSPAPLHPSTADIEVVIGSIRHQLPTAEIVIVFDGVRPEDEGRRWAYEEYTRRLLWLINYRWQNVVPVIMKEWGHQANAVREALRWVRTPLILFCEHDTPIKGAIPWFQLCSMVEHGDAGLVRLHHESSVLPSHEAHQLDDGPISILGVPVLRFSAWWQRPHLTTTSMYTDRVMPYFSGESRTMIEEVMYGVTQSAYNEHGEDGWRDWKIFLFAPKGDMQTSWHLDSRQEMPKYDMYYDYPGGGTPEGAPRATKDRTD